LTLFRAVPYLRRFQGWTGTSAYVAVFRVFHVTDQLEQEIRTLRSLFWSDRDPEGLAFAPLADAYRRAGEFRQAVELLSHGRVRHPDFVTGHVVAARLFMEKGLLEEGELAARRALELDEDNVVALGLLADAFEAKGETLDAMSLRARLSELTPGDGPVGVEEGGLAIVAPVPDEPTVAEEPVMDIAELAPDEPTVAEEPVMDIAELTPDEPTVVEESVVDIAALTPDEPAAVEEPVVDIAELAPDEPVAVEEPVMDIAAPVPDEAAAVEEPVVDIAELASDEPMAVEEPVMDIAALTPDEPTVAEEPEGEPDFEDDGMLVTRTLADLYARQGFKDEALEVYHQLLQIDPHDQELRRKVAALDSGPGEETRAEDQSVEQEGSPERAALEDDEPVGHVWQTQAHAEGHDVDTPFAWIAEDSEESTAAAPPISEYFRRLLAWERGASNAEAGEEDRGEDPGSGNGGNAFPHGMNEDRP
jgi:tetratricopeptide (TPR) repeat protein